MNYVAKLNEYSAKFGDEVKYEEVSCDGPAHIRTFTMRAVVNGKPYANGTGKNKKDAKQDAAKHAYLEMGLDRNDPVTVSSPGENRQSSVCRTDISQPNYTCWLNEYCQKNGVQAKPVESTRMVQSNATPCCRFLVGGKEYPAGLGRTKKEAKEEAARQVFDAIMTPHNDTAVVHDENGSDIQAQQKEESSHDVSAISEKLEALAVNTNAKEPMIAKTDYIGILNRHCQKIKVYLDFHLVEKRGPSHDPVFVYKVVIDKREYTEGVGKTKKEAEQNAAYHAWTALQEQSDCDSQISCKSTASEDGSLSSSSEVSSSKESIVVTSGISSNDSESIVFTESSLPPKRENVTDVKPKIKLAPNFTVTPEIKKTTPLSKPHPPSRFTSEFDSIERIGKGGFGRVFKARRKLENRFYAVKMVQSKKKALREVGALADFQHPNIVRYYTSWIDYCGYNYNSSDINSNSWSSSGLADQYLYIQMELCDKKTLRVWIDEKNMLRWDPRRREEGLDIALQIVSGVEYIHSRGKFHRDMKPPNIMFGTDQKVKIGDFGLVTAETINNNSENSIEKTMGTGTPSYMAPEQLVQTNYNKQVDIFAMGLIYFEVLWKLSTGHETATTWVDIRSQKFPGQFSKEFGTEAKMIKSMLSVKPEDRPDAAELKAQLEQFSLVFTGQQNVPQQHRTV